MMLIDQSGGRWLWSCRELWLSFRRSGLLELRGSSSSHRDSAGYHVLESNWRLLFTHFFQHAAHAHPAEPPLLTTPQPRNRHYKPIESPQAPPPLDTTTPLPVRPLLRNYTTAKDTNSPTCFRTRRQPPNSRLNSRRARLSSQNRRPLILALPCWLAQNQHTKVVGPSSPRSSKSAPNPSAP